jgi:hypothetical protein
MKRYFLISIYTLGLFISIAAQNTNLRDIFLSAESYFLFEEYDEALPLYLRINRQDPENDNVNYKIGVCYLNNPYEKNKSIFYLEKAVKNINLKYKENNYRETSAPLDALYYLGNAYRINNELGKAKTYYNLFLEKMDPMVFDEEIVNDQLKAIEIAESLKARPIDFDYSILGENINSRFSDERAVISGNESKLVYISKLQFYDAVLFSEKVNGKWSNPRNIIPELGVDGDVYPTCLSWDGTELFLYRSDDFIGNIYVSKYKQGKWTPIEKLNENINTRFWESHASISKDGTKLFFSSNRKGGFGGLDIYVSERFPEGDWQTPVLLGPSINSKYNEDTPFITEDGKKLYFSSFGHQGMGGYDVFVSVLNDDGSWAEPRNLGYPINSTADDLFFHPYRNGKFALYSRYKEDGFGRHDIYNYQVYNYEFPRMYLIAGQLDYEGSLEPADLNIRVVNTKSNETLSSLTPEADGSFSFSLPAGSYNLVFNGSKFHEIIKNLEINQLTPHSGIKIPEKITMIPLPRVLSPEESDKLLSLRDTALHVESDKPVKIRYNAERGSSVIINVYNDNELIASDTIDSARRRDDFEFTPKAGLNTIIFNSTDKDGNTTSKTAEVMYNPKMEDRELKDNKAVSGPEIIEIPLELTEPTEMDIKKMKEFNENAEGNLKNYLDKNNFNSNNSQTFINHLRENAASNNFTDQDINNMIANSYSLYDTRKLLENLAKVPQAT